MRLDLPPAFVSNVLAVQGKEGGAAFLEQLPTLVSEAAERWQLRLEPPFADLSYNWTAPGADAKGRPVVLKVGYPPDLAPEIAALRYYDGAGAVDVLAVDEEAGLLLLERALPGTPLKAIDDDVAATEIAATLIRRLCPPLPPGHGFRPLQEWARGFDRLRDQFDGDTGPFPEALVAQAEETFRTLLAEPFEPVLLHGDLHHDNILSAGREPWLAIDPKGVAGPREFEVVAFLENPRPELLQRPFPGRILRRRLQQFAEALDVDVQILRQWAIAQGVLSSVWTFEGHGEVGEFALTCAKLLRDDADAPG